MKVLLVNGSPHSHGCTYTALSEVATTLNKNGIETQILWLNNKPLSGCLSCGYCVKEGKCAIDDIVNEFVDLAKTCDGFIFGAPVHFSAPSAAIKAFMDRAFYVAYKKYFSGKPAAAIVSCRRSGGSAAFEQLNQYFALSSMPIVTSQYWNIVHGNTPDEVKKDAEGMQTMRTLGNNMAWLLKCIQLGKENNLNPVLEQTRIRTNFIDSTR